MPDTPQNQAVWPQHDNQLEGVGFPIMRVVALMSFSTASVIDFRYGPFKGKGTGEHALARELLGSLEFGDIVLADRYYGSYYFIAELLQKGVDIITRQHGSRESDFRCGLRIDQGDHVIELVKPPRPSWMDKKTYETMPKTIALREIKTGIIDEEDEEVVIITTLVCPESYSRSELAACYKKRWNIELDLRSLKSVMGMDILACKTPEMITKELWTYILAYNLVRQLISKSAAKHSLEPRQISFTAAMQTLLAFIPLFDSNPPPETRKRYYDAMLRMIASHRIGNRPGRSEPRLVKRRPKPKTFLTRPRGESRTGAR
jgi:hypothetical protein